MIVKSLVFFLLLMNGKNLFAQGVDFVNASPAEAYVQLDQNYNVWRRIKAAQKNSDSNKTSQDAILSREEKEAKTVYLIELYKAPEENSIKGVSKEDLLRLTGPRGGRVVPLFEEDFAAFKNLGRFIEKTKAYKLLGRNSWYLEETPGGLGGVFFKIIPDIPLYREKADRALFMVDYLNEGVLQSEYKFEDLFIPEFLQTTVKTNLFSKNKIFVFRSAKAILKPRNNTRVLPVHGLLGTDIKGQNNPLERILKNNTNYSVRKWKKQEFIPRLAEITAFLHFNLGVSLENHTQNLLAEINMENGELTRLFMRDLGDALLNPLPRALKNPNSLKIFSEKGVRFLNVAYYSWIEPGKDELTQIGYNTSVYTGQSLDSHGKTFKDRIGWNALFLKHYLSSVANITGVEIRLSKESQTIIEALKKAKKMDEIPEVPNLLKGKLDSAVVFAIEALKKAKKMDETPEVPNLLKGKLDSAVAFVVEEVYQSTLAGLNQKFFMSKLNFDIDQKKAEVQFKKALSGNKVFFSGLDAREALVSNFKKTWLGEKISHFIKTPSFGLKSNLEMLKFAEYEGHIFAIDPDNQKILAGVFMAKNDAGFINTTILKKESSIKPISCSRILN